MYGMYGSIDSIGSKGKNPFIQQPGQNGVQNNPFTANKPDDNNGGGFDASQLFKSQQVGINQNPLPEVQKATIGIA